MIFILHALPWAQIQVQANFCPYSTEICRIDKMCTKIVVTVGGISYEPRECYYCDGKCQPPQRYSHSDPRSPEHLLPYVTMGLQLQLRIFRGADYTGLFGWVQCNHKGHYKWKGEEWSGSESERYYAVSLEVEEGARRQEIPIHLWVVKGIETELPLEPPEGTWPY